jgi:hypothetical protein
MKEDDDGQGLRFGTKGLNINLANTLYLAMIQVLVTHQLGSMVCRSCQFYNNLFVKSFSRCAGDILRFHTHLPETNVFLKYLSRSAEAVAIFKTYGKHHDDPAISGKNDDNLEASILFHD